MGKKSLRLHASLRRSRLVGSPRTRAAIRRVSCQTEMASSKSFSASVLSCPGREGLASSELCRGQRVWQLEAVGQAHASLQVLWRPEQTPPWPPFPLGTQRSDFMLSYLYRTQHIPDGFSLEEHLFPVPPLKRE